MRSPVIRFATLWLMLLTTSGCYRQTFVNYAVNPTGEEDSTHRVFGLWGLIGDADVDVSTMCKQEAHKITWSAGPLDVLVSIVTLGLVGMRSISVECGAYPTGGK
jgi:hypothetical protein